MGVRELPLGSLIFVCIDVATEGGRCFWLELKMKKKNNKERGSVLDEPRRDWSNGVMK